MEEILVKQRRITALIVGLALDPAAGRQTPEQVLSALVIDQDEKREGHGGQPPVELEGIHSQALVHAGSVGQEGGQAGLEDEAEIHEHVPHALLEH